MQSWRIEIRKWAQDTAVNYANRQGILGVIMGGSLARGQEWRHSDMEIGVLVEEKDLQMPYFNIHEGRGVEVIQLVRRELLEEMNLIEAGDATPLRKWHIQLWEGRIVSDPTGVLGRFKRLFDEGLFSAEVVNQRVEDQQAKITAALGQARQLLAARRPAAALVNVRLAMNDAILAFHWAHGELPRSQNRTDSRLRQLCRKHSEPSFYALYREIFGLQYTRRAIRTAWPSVREQVLDITRLWGDSTRDFFDLAVDSHFTWRQNAGILTVYRLYIPIIGGEEGALVSKLDDPNWVKDNPRLAVFLGFDKVAQDQVAGWVEQLERTVRHIPRS